MKMTNAQLWERFQRFYTEFPSIDLAVDISRMNFSDAYWNAMREPLGRAFREMEKLEAGARANPDERDDNGEKGRMVGHYWLRSPQLAPTKHIQKEIRSTLAAVKPPNVNVSPRPSAAAMMIKPALTVAIRMSSAACRGNARRALMVPIFTA